MKPVIHRIDSRFFVADDGRIIFRAGTHYVVVPEPDLGLVRRRNMQANTCGVIAVVVSNVGWPAAYWRPWWLAVGIAMWVAAYLWVGRWVRERYADATDPTIARDVRAAVDRTLGPAVGNDIVAGVFGLIAFIAALLQNRPRSPWLLFLLVALTHLHGAFRNMRRLNETDAESTAGVTR